MGRFRSWLGNTLFNIDKVVESSVNSKLKGLTVPQTTGIENYRMIENKVWASANADNLLTFYKMNHDRSNALLQDRLRFWQWVGGIDVPKLHYPAPTALLQHIKSLLFSEEVEIYIATGDEEKDVVYNKRKDDLLKDIEFNNKVQAGSYFESYSGTLAVKFIIDKEVHDKPIIELYPRERIEIATKYGKAQEIIFNDEYKVKDKVYTLKSYYGIGYIDYELVDEKDKVVPLKTIPELAELERLELGVPIPTAIYKKNKAVNAENPDSVYGGSDFEGVIDLFHQIDEIYSTLALYIRRSRPTMMVDESLLPASKDGSRTIIPKEYDFDMIKVRSLDDNKDKIYRSTPEIKTEQYMNSIKELNKAVYQTVGMSYTSVGLEGVGANTSGEALRRIEKSTIIMREAKIKLWIPFIEELIRLLFIYDDLLNNNTISDLYEGIDIQVAFAEYNAQSFKELIEQYGDAKLKGLADTETAVNDIYTNKRGYNEEQRKVITRNIKIEQGEPFVSSNQMVDDEGNA